jgi:nucleotide-binding universal stress UspA family protein
LEGGIQLYKSILITLDGSELSEAALPHLATVYKGCEGKPLVTVLLVVEPVEKPPLDVVTTISRETAIQVEKETIKKGQEYLDGIVRKFDKLGIPASTKLLMGKAADTIVDYINKNNCDLLVMSTHGRSGVSRWVMGSVADKILSHVCVPILMIRAPKCGPLFKMD